MKNSQLPKFFYSTLPNSISYFKTKQTTSESILSLINSFKSLLMQMKSCFDLEGDRCLIMGSYVLTVHL